MITWDDFAKVDIRVGTIKEASLFPRARKALYKLLIDFGELGTLQSSAQITDLYDVTGLRGMQVIAVINLGNKQVADFISECLVLGVYNEENQVVLLNPSLRVKNGSKIG